MSIKNKLVTAITTAGLLAGLFGSAFVPTAYAAATTDPATVSGAIYLTSATQGNGTSTVPYGLATAAMATTGFAVDLTVSDFAGTVTNAKPLTFTASSGFYVSATNAACAAVGSPTTASVSVNTSAAGLGCMSVKAVSAAQAPSKGTITIASVNGTIKTYYVANLGSVATVVLAVRTGFISHVAISNAEVTDYLSVTARDSAGTLIASTVTGDYTQTNTNGGTAAVVTTGAALRLDLNADACATTKVSGDTIAVAVTHTATAVASNTLTLTCTGEANKISSLELDGVASGVAAGSSGTENSLKVFANVVDAGGRLVGEGGAVLDFTTTAGLFADAVGLNQANHIAFSPRDATGFDITGDITADDDADGGQVQLGVWVLRTDDYGTQYLRVLVPNNDLAVVAAGGDAVAATFTVSYTSVDPAGAPASSTIGIVAGPKLKKATITLSAAAGKLVTVTIEKVSTGKTYTYYRKANASGVATFTIRRTGTWEVFAAYGDDVTETVTLKK